MDKKSFPLKTQSYIANAIYIAVAFIINANNNSNFVLFLSITFYPITFYPITTQTSFRMSEFDLQVDHMGELPTRWMHSLSIL